MNLDSLSFALSQISYSVANVTKKNFKTTIQELSALLSKHGIEAERYLLRCLFSHVDFSGDGKSSGKDFHQTQFLIQECNALVCKPDFVSSCCYAVDNPLNQQKSLRPSPQLFSLLSKTLKLNQVQEVAFGIALLNSSVPEIQNFAETFIKQKVPDLLVAYLDSEISGDQESSLQASPPEVIHFLLSHFQQRGNKDNALISAEQRDSFLQSLRNDFPRDQVPIVVAPLLYSDKFDITVNKATVFAGNMAQESEQSIAEYITEIGYGLTSSFDDCHSNLLNLGQHELSPGTVARILTIMAQTHSSNSSSDSVFVQKLNSSGLSIWNDSKDKSDLTQATSWNVEIFVDVLRDLVPTLKWAEVMPELDHQGFHIKDRNGLKLLWTGLTHGFRDEAIPMESLYAKWRNPEGQLTLFHQILKNSDIVCLTDYQCHPVSVDVLKAPPEDDSRDISNWKSLNLIESLLYLSDHGQYPQVQELFKFPVQNCPDLSVLGLLQVSAPMNMLRQELLTTLIPIFLGNHPNSAIILQYAWHCQTHSNTVKPIIMHSMAEWYVHGDYDQTRLSRILDVAQDLKALSALLNGSHFPFVIDLACLASRREYLKLDKWLSDKIREHGEPFMQACVGFLKRRCPQILGGIVKEENLPKSAQLPPETLASMLTCLQACAGNVSQELSEAILTMVGNCNILLNKPRQPPPGVVKTPRGLEPAFSSPTIATSTASSLSQLETLSALGTSMAGLSLGGTGPPLGSAPGASGPPPASGIITNAGPVSVGGPIMPSVSTAAGNVSTSGGPFHLSSGLGQLSSSSIGSSPAKMFPPAGATVTSTHNTTHSNPFSGLPIPTQLGQFSSQLDMTNIFPEPISKDVEEEANGYFQRIYNHPPHPTLTIDEFLELLKKYQESLVKREREVLNCMVRNLFEEYRYFPQYPEKELSITAQLFGGIIEQSIVTYMALGLALRCVLDALRKPHGTKMYYFGITALDRFKTRLKDYSQYCQHLASIPHFHEFPQHLIEYVEYGARSQEPPSRPQSSALPLAMPGQGMGPIVVGGQLVGGLVTSSAAVVSVAAALSRPLTSAAVTVTTTTTITKPSTIPGKPSIANATNIDTLLVATEKDEKLVVPPEAVQDKMFFIINNLSQINLTQKTEEFKELVKDDYWAWAAQYLVLKRASIELNFHTLYSNFLDALKIPELTKYVINETFRNIKVLLRSDKGIANFSDRSLLKNLGHWLGMITLAKNKPILQTDIDVKALLMEAYHNGQQELLYVVPFVAKVMESCSKSKVFRTPNPWVLGIMNVLAEMHQEPNLKLNLKFEIEVLCKTLSIDINELKPGSILKDHERLTRIDTQLSPLPKLGDQLGGGGQQRSIQVTPSHHLQPGLPMGVVSGPGSANAVASAVASAVGMAGADVAPWPTRMGDLPDARRMTSVGLPSGFSDVAPWPTRMGDLSDARRMNAVGLPSGFSDVPHWPGRIGDPQDIQRSSAGPSVFSGKSAATTWSLTNMMSAPESSLLPNVDEVGGMGGPMVGSVTSHLSGGGTPTSGGPSTATPVAASLMPQFSYMDINVLSVGGMAQHIQINNQLPLFQAHPQLKKFVRPAIELAVQEWIMPVVERSIKISLTTCEQIAKKDFALDPEESRMRMAAHHMIRNLTAGMTMITCRDPLHVSITTNLKAAFMTALRAASEQQKNLIEQAAQVVSQDNVELACCFVQKTAIEKALADMDKRLATDFDLRKHARSEGRRYCDPVVLTYQAERMPEQIRLKVGCVTPMQMAVYEEFSRYIPGFLPTDKDPHTAFPNKPVPQVLHYAVDDLTQIYDKIIAELEHYLHSLLPFPGNPQVAALHSLHEAVTIARNARDTVTAMALIQKSVEGLLEGLSQLPSDPEVTVHFRDGHLLVLKGLGDTRAYGHIWVSKQVTRCLLECNQEFKYNLDALDCLVRHHLVNMQTYDINLAKLMENGMNYMATAFAIQLVRLYMIEERQSVVSESDLYNTMETLIRIAAQTRPPPPESLVQLIQLLRASSVGSGAPNPPPINNSNGSSGVGSSNGSTTGSVVGSGAELDRAPGGPISMMHSGISQAREFDDPPGLHEKTEFLLREWVSMYHSSGRDTTKAFTLFVHQMNVQGILKTDDLITRFFRLSTEMCVELCYRALGEHSNAHMSLIHNKCFPTLDAYVRLISLLVKHSGDASNSVTKANLLNKVLGIVTGVLLQDHEVHNNDFQQLPYHRIFIMLFLELSSTEPVLESLGFQVILAFCNTLHILRPSKAPGFAYAWLEIMSHRVFLGRVLAQNPLQKAWGLYAQLLVDLFKFLAPFLRNVELPKPIQLLYKGTLRVLLVLLHDFPEFLCDFHYNFCDVIPPNCIQMRNLILSAFPRNMRLPDPFTPNLKVELLQEIMQAPKALNNFPSIIEPLSFKKNLDSYIQSRSPVTFLSELRSNLQVSSDPGMRYNIVLINALVLYVGTQAISYIQSKGLTPSMSTITHSSHMDIFQNLAVDLDTEGRYLFLNAIANQLRYPNSHTHYFSCTLLYLFAEANTEAIQEQITRVLLERLIVNRPHPWGLLVTFIELIKNSTFKFWNHEFVRCAPEIEKLFESVARSCMQQKPPMEQTGS